MISWTAGLFAAASLAATGLDAEMLDLTGALREEIATLYNIQTYPGIQDELRPGMAVAQEEDVTFDPRYRVLCTSNALHGRSPALHDRSITLRRIQVREGDRSVLAYSLDLVREAVPALNDLLGIDIEITRARAWTMLREAERGPIRPFVSCLAALQRSGAIDAIPARINRVVYGNLTVILQWRGPTPVSDAHLEAVQKLAKMLFGDAWAEVGRATLHAEGMVLGGTDDSGMFLDRMSL